MADDYTVTPGPSPNTVHAADGKILIPPEGWIVLPPGDAALTLGQRRLAIIGWSLRGRGGKTSHEASGHWQRRLTAFGQNSKPNDPRAHHSVLLRRPFCAEDVEVSA